jgi:hypothetical protein
LLRNKTQALKITKNLFRIKNFTCKHLATSGILANGSATFLEQRL